MGQGTTRVVDANGAGAKVRELGEQITHVRHRLDALVSELDRRRHRVTDVRRHLRRHAGSVAVGVLVVGILAVAAPVALSRRRRRPGVLARHTTELRDKARSLGQALGRIADDPDRVAPPRPPVISANTIVAIALTVAPILARWFLLAPGAGRR
jgi:hypothetical protein